MVSGGSLSQSHPASAVLSSINIFQVVSGGASAEIPPPQPTSGHTSLATGTSLHNGAALPLGLCTQDLTLAPCFLQDPLCKLVAPLCWDLNPSPVTTGLPLCRSQKATKL